MEPLEVIRTASEDETIAAGARLAESLQGVVLLHGDLGAGKDDAGARYCLGHRRNTDG